MSTALIVGATRGLGLELAKSYNSLGYSVTGTARNDTPSKPEKGLSWITGVDLAEESAGKTIAAGLHGVAQDIVIISAGYFVKESLDDTDFEAEVKMYKISAIGPVFVVQALHKAGLLKKGCKVILISSEAGSIALRDKSEGGGMYGHHASKTALNMIGRLLSLDLAPFDVAVAMVHPGFMRTDLTKGVGFDKYWDDGGAVTPDVAAKALVEWVDKFEISQSGQYWAPRGPGDIGTVEAALGPKESLSTPLQLPW